MEHHFLFNVLIFLVSACIVVPLASRFKLGAVLGYLIAGIAIGPFGLKLIDNNKEIAHFAEFGVVMMLFIIGLELHPTKLWRMKKIIVGLGGLQMLITSLAFTSVGIMLGYNLQLSLALGMALSLSSTALVLQILEEKQLLKTNMGSATFAILLLQDIAVIGILIIMPLLSNYNIPTDKENVKWFTNIAGWQHALIVASAIGFIVIIGNFLSNYVFYFIAKTKLREIFTAISLALIVGITLLMQFIGISPALGAFIAGVMLANSDYKRTIETDIEPFKSLLLGLFFISVGMGMNFNLMIAEPYKVLMVVGLLLSIKIPILFLLSRLFGMRHNQSIGLAFVLSQGGEFAFVLFQYASNLRIIDMQGLAILNLSVALSMVTTPLLMLYYTYFIVPKFMSVLPERKFDQINEHNDVIIAGFGRFGQIIGRFLGAQGVKTTILEKDPDQIELLRKFGYKGYFGDALRVDLLKSAAADKAKIIVIAISNADVSLEMISLIKENFPHLKIFARARNRRHAYELHKLGVDYFRREIFDSSLILASEVMMALGYNQSDMDYKAKLFSKHDEEILRHSFEFFEKEKELISYARQASGELERILNDDVK